MKVIFELLFFVFVAAFWPLTVPQVWQLLYKAVR